MSTVQYAAVVLRPIPNWPAYAAGDDGYIYRTEPRTGWADGLPLPYRLKFRPHKNSRGPTGYATAVLYRRRPEGTMQKRTLLVHCLVAAAWHGPRPKGMEVDHVDRDRANSKPDNLEYVTPIINNARAGSPPTLSEDEVRQIRSAVASGHSINSQALLFGINYRHAWLVARGKKRRDVA